MVYWEVESQDKNKGEKDMTQQKGQENTRCIKDLVTVLQENSW